MNGYFDSIENNPWHVSLNMPGSIWLTDDHICGGVIIGKQWILSVDHCTYDRPGLFVRAGTADSTWWGTSIDIKEIYHYNAHESNDYIINFAVIKLKSELKFSEKMNKIKIPDENFDLTGNYTAAVSGYGKTGAIEELSQYLKRAELSIIITDKCNLERRTTNRICARDLHQKATSTKINTIQLFISKLLVCPFFSL